MKPFSVDIKVFYEDTDLSGRVYHTRYLNFAERARSLWLESFNFNQSQKLRDQGMFFAVSSLAINYFAPASLGEVLRVTFEPQSMTPARLVAHQQVIAPAKMPAETPAKMPSIENEESEEARGFTESRLLAGIDITIVWLDHAAERPRRFPPEIIQMAAQST